MNNFVIACGSYLIPLSEFAVNKAQEIGAVSVDMGKTSCGVPLATKYIQKVVAHGSLGKKRKKVKC
jgi:Zn finger protein HypA/HybF involved in hydrogenase expression